MFNSILLLNASYEPLAVLSLPHAVSLLLRERVEPVTEEQLTLRGSASGIAVVWLEMPF
jgi:hypothetical protein